MPRHACGVCTLPHIASCESSARRGRSHVKAARDTPEDDQGRSESGNDRSRKQAAARSQLREATVLDPALNDDGWIRVELDDVPGNVKECPFTVTDADPTPGDAAVVMESDQGNWWCLVWWAQGG